MKKVLIIGVFLAIISAFANASQNKVCFSNAQIESEELLGYSITTGQTFESRITVPEDEDYRCLQIYAGRQKSTTPVNWVQESLAAESIEWDQGNMTVSTAGGDSTPKELNFAFSINLKLLLHKNIYDCSNLYFGYGSYNAIVQINNWWLFSNNNDKKHTITCTLTGTGQNVNLGIERTNNANIFKLSTSN